MHIPQFQEHARNNPDNYTCAQHAKKIGLISLTALSASFAVFNAKIGSENLESGQVGLAAINLTSAGICGIATSLLYGVVASLQNGSNMRAPDQQQSITLPDLEAAPAPAPIII